MLKTSPSRLKALPQRVQVLCPARPPVIATAWLESMCPHSLPLAHLLYSTPQALGLQDEGFNVTTRESLQREGLHTLSIVTRRCTSLPLPSLRPPSRSLPHNESYRYRRFGCSSCSLAVPRRPFPTTPRLCSSLALSARSAPPARPLHPTYFLLASSHSLACQALVCPLLSSSTLSPPTPHPTPCSLLAPHPAHSPFAPRPLPACSPAPPDLYSLLAFSIPWLARLWSAHS